ncbi:hypothetical protein RND81_04G244200 [Saponaria officinalis]|uniref:WPP domain-containing protein n=1 Tax=Saponaria officinalis TaxID=3572 RepID=A0AAW1LH94_SAPOF
MSSENQSTETTMQDDAAAAAAVAPPKEQQSPPSSAADALSEKLDKIKISSSFSIWPPTQRTRDAVTNRLIETLSTPSILSKRYGTVSPDEASVIAKSIEEEAFAFAASSAAAAAAVGATEDPIDGGIEILQVYSKEISKRVLDAVKSRSAVAAAASEDPIDAVATDVGSNEGDVAPVSSAENESSSA